MRIEVLVDVKTTLGEGPLWDVGASSASTGSTVSTDACSAPRRTAREIRCWDVPQKIGSMALRKDGGGAVVSLASGFHFLDFRRGDVELINDPEPDKRNNRLNDGKVDKRGRFVAGSMDTMEEGPNGALYRLDPGLLAAQARRRHHRLERPLLEPGRRAPSISPTRGPATSGPTTTTNRLVRSSNRRTFVSVDRSRGGAADGSTVDAEGCLWNALVYDGTVGALRLRTAASIASSTCRSRKSPASCSAGPNLDILFVTSMAKPPLPRFPGDGRLRGSLFAISGLGIKGIPEPRFGA